ncbi:hypothetical protein [Sandaracinobacteroides saxicola]|uniref:Uncharacterized protein n=1 Tax=Sandaracinobacteroides saxicola TaxID=2759707 RepID=A0A7G5IHF8_9SPHN|nr:hypothetical protein [Sandaracinobacteroides saxicola]QMW22800.1 hypothetical protein H3309_16115 [Sandaracinobacteroides saxicola]
MRFVAKTMLLLALAAPAMAKPLTPEEVKAVADLPASGKVRDCLQLREIQETRPVGKNIIMFRTGVNRWLRSDLPFSCNADSSTTFVIKSSIGNLCSIDTIDVVDPFTKMNRGFCKLGKFTPVAVPKGMKF